MKGGKHGTGRKKGMRINKHGDYTYASMASSTFQPWDLRYYVKLRSVSHRNDNKVPFHKERKNPEGRKVNVL